MARFKLQLKTKQHVSRALGFPLEERVRAIARELFCCHCYTVSHPVPRVFSAPKSNVGLRTRLEASRHPTLSTRRGLIHGNVATRFSSRHPRTDRIHELAASGHA